VRGMFVQLLVHADPGAALLRIPERCIQPGNVVWRVRDGQLNRIQLRNQYPLDDAILVPIAASPLLPGDELVISPLPVAAEGMEVRIKTAATASREASRR
jgi:hypothetical protein